MNDQLDPIDSHITASREDPARKMQQRRDAKERRKTSRPIPPPPPVGERRQTQPNYQNAPAKSGSGLLSKFTFVLLLGAIGGAGYLYYQQDLMVKSLTKTNESTNERIVELEAQLRASDTLLEQTEDVTASTINLTKKEIRSLRESTVANKTLANNNENDVNSLKSSLKSVNTQLSSLSTADSELKKTGDSLRWLANQAKNTADSTDKRVGDLEGKIGQLDAISKKVASLDGVSAKVAEIDVIKKRISIIDELEVAVDSIKPADTSAIENAQNQIIDAQNQLLSSQNKLASDQGDIKFALELIAERITNLEVAIDVIDDHRMRIQQDLADLKQTP